MKIRMCDSLEIAHNVVKALNKITPKDIAKDCHLESWSNCREQGLCLKHYPVNKMWKTIVFSECRNSDSILVISGYSNTGDFNPQTNQPSEKAYSCRKLFDWKDYNGAATYILNILKK